MYTYSVSLHICGYSLHAFSIDTTTTLLIARNHFLDERERVLDSTKEIVKNNNVCGVAGRSIEIEGGMGVCVVLSPFKEGANSVYSACLLASRRW